MCLHVDAVVEPITGTATANTLTTLLNKDLPLLKSPMMVDLFADYAAECAGRPLPPPPPFPPPPLPLMAASSVPASFDPRALSSASGSATHGVHSTGSGHALVTTTGQCGACGKSGAAKECSVCMAAWYCNANCQQAAWRLHKKTCVARASATGSSHPPPAAVSDVSDAPNTGAALKSSTVHQDTLD
jgi:hypothetical protein